MSLRKLLTRRVLVQDSHGKKTREVILEPDEKLVYGVKLVLGMTGFLSGIEVASMAFLHEWNSDIFAAITNLIGLITGILISQKS
jgi:hypothetical protein